MIILSQTTDKLQVVLQGAITTDQLQCVVSWRDRTSTTFIAGRSTSVTNNTTQVIIANSPAASTQRIIDFISLYNSDTTTAYATITYNDNGTLYILWAGFLEVGQYLNFVEGFGWSVSDGYKSIKSFTVHGDAGANFTMTNATQAERFAGNTTRHLFMVDLNGYNQVRFRSNKQVASASVNTPQFIAKYYTTYNTTVGNFLNLTAGGELYISMAAIGYFDSGWVNMVSGAKKAGICIGFTEKGGDGAADPAVGATDILFR